MQNFANKGEVTISRPNCGSVTNTRIKMAEVSIQNITYNIPPSRKPHSMLIQKAFSEKMLKRLYVLKSHKLPPFVWK